MPKRRKTEDGVDNEKLIPTKARKIENEDAQEETPSKRKSALRKTPRKSNAFGEVEGTPSSLRKMLFSASSKAVDDDAIGGDEETPTAERNEQSDDESQEEHNSDEDEDEDEDEAPTSSAAATPKRRPGRPKGSKNRQRTPSPPPHLPPHELYFFQNRPGATKTSSNTFPAKLLLKHEDYFARINAYKNPHEADIRRLTALHRRAFDQWRFELDEGFGIALYGYGSKRELVMDFAGHLYAQTEGKVVVVNGYAPGLTVNDILSTLAGVLLPKNIKLPAQPSAALDLLLSALSRNAHPITLIIHSLDHANLRKPNTQTVLSRLASHTNIHLLATFDTPTFPLLWDTTTLRQFCWLYHDATTFQPYTAEISVVDEVNALLGRSGRQVGGKDGVAYVLRSLPENARKLFRILLAEQLAAGSEMEIPAQDAMSDDDILGTEDEDEALAAPAEQDTPSRRRRGRPPKAAKTPTPSRPGSSASPGIEYRTLYHKAVEEFVCSSELNFRTLLKEFHDHQIIESRKDAMGTERLLVPFRREELEAVMEELV